MREKHRSAASSTSPIGDVPATQVHALDRNRTWDPSVRRLMLHPLSQTGFGFLIYFIDFLQRGRERDRELETSMREKHRPAASCTLPTGDVPATQVHALDRNRTWDLSVRRPTLYPPSQTGFGENLFFNSLFFFKYIFIDFGEEGRGRAKHQ
uniref:Uncharacterized protein n=1 Tax=Myotis myotis TaxID=51298 RepID=A0A7J7Z5B5_MYOMY|nr:hypothetical protein mMyoMyo1_010673 [Myotis myotis]